MSEFGDFFEKPYRDMKKMARPDLEQELNQWRNLYTWIDPGVQYWLTKVGEDIRVSLRNGTSFVGKLGTVEYEAKVVRLAVTERLYDYTRGEATYETKDVLCKISDLVGWQFIYAKEVFEEDFQGKRASGEESVPDIELEKGGKPSA